MVVADCFTTVTVCEASGAWRLPPLLAAASTVLVRNKPRPPWRRFALAKRLAGWRAKPRSHPDHKDSRPVGGPPPTPRRSRPNRLFARGRHLDHGAEHAPLPQGREQLIESRATRRLSCRSPAATKMEAALAGASTGLFSGSCTLVDRPLPPCWITLLNRMTASSWSLFRHPPRQSSQVGLSASASRSVRILVEWVLIRLLAN